jgi:hypothetical protein
MLSISHKNLQSISCILGIGCILIICILFAVAAHHKRQNIELGNTHILAFMNERKSPPMAIVECQIADQVFYGWISDTFSSRLVPSLFGPAVYVFNQEGILVDATGDNLDYPLQSKWKPLWQSYEADEKEKFLSVEDIRNRFTVLPVHADIDP